MDVELSRRSLLDLEASLPLLGAKPTVQVFEISFKSCETPSRERFLRGDLRAPAKLLIERNARLEIDVNETCSGSSNRISRCLLDA